MMFQIYELHGLGWRGNIGFAATTSSQLRHCIYILVFFFSSEKILPGTTHHDWSRYAGISLALALVNIAMIWISSMLMFRLKEVLPIEKKVFWSDLGIARKIYQGTFATTC